MQISPRLRPLRALFFRDGDTRRTFCVSSRHSRLNKEVDMRSAIRCSVLVMFVALCLTPGAAIGEAQIRRVPVGGDIQRPRVVHKVLPPYPDAAREKRIEGEVLMEIVVGTDGSVREAKVTKGAEASLDAAALGAVRQWRYEVTRVDGDTVEVVMPESLKFILPKT